MIWTILCRLDQAGFDVVGAKVVVVWFPDPVVGSEAKKRS